MDGRDCRNAGINRRPPSLARSSVARRIVGVKRTRTLGTAALGKSIKYVATSEATLVQSAFRHCRGFYPTPRGTSQWTPRKKGWRGGSTEAGPLRRCLS